MSLVSLKFLSEVRLTELRRSVESNRDRYVAGDFLDLARDNGWAIEASSVSMDVEALSGLDGTNRTAEADIKNSLIVYAALPGLTPAMAREERIWTRLTHVECLRYSRARWLAGEEGVSLDKAIHAHLFAASLTGVRDDNAIARLWWNMHIATIADPQDPQGALGLLIRRADVRMQFVERSRTAARPRLAKAIVRAMRREPWLTSTEDSFRAFMIAMNRDCSGVLFEALSDEEADVFVEACVGNARAAS